MGRKWITTSLRGRPRNTAQPPPAHLAISSRTVSQFDHRRIGRPLESGKSTGQRAIGQRLQPSVRRRRSQWEITEEFRPISRRARSQDQIVAVRLTTNIIRQRAPPRCGRCCHRLWACIVAFGDALSQEDPQEPQEPQDPLNLPEDALAFFGLNPSNIYERASSCNLDFFSSLLSLSLRYSLIKDRQLQQNCLHLT
jgi:hypothetical protein